MIPVHEQRKLNPGDEVGFGWCTSKENANPCQGDPKPCIFRVLKEEPKEDTVSVFCPLLFLDFF